jgi:cohesin complex subunit SA-1/2
VTEYPLISKSRGTSSYRQTLSGFMQSLVSTIDKADILFEEADLLEVITAWISTLSSTGNRALRHTATYIALCVMSALCGVGRDLVDNKAKLQRQVEGERKKNKSNKSRISEMDAAKQKVDQQEQLLRERLQDLFDTVFVHRYRDVDAHIRLDCIHELGNWIMTYPDVYFEGAYLRYLGWLLSDQKPEIRLEVIKGLTRLFKDSTKLSGLEGFTEKFRPRITEMATRDSDASVRAAAIELLDMLRDAQFLEPDDIDAVGRLIFDSEPKVRKAVVNFFVANVEDGYQMKLEEIGGSETTEELFGEDKDEEDYDSPRLEWLKLKAVVEQLQSYDAQLEIEPAEVVKVPETNSYMLVPGMESRFSLAAEGICDQIPEMDWQILAGYLLYDHSKTARNGTRNGVDSMSQFKDAVRLTSEEDLLLLEVLNTSVRLALSSSNPALHEKTKKISRAQRVADQDALEEGARHLTTLIPRLLSKFGAIPEAASSILRLEHVLNPDNQDYAAYGTLLEDIKKQFLAHVKPRVLEEASRALLHAKSAAEGDDLAQDKLTGLSDNAIEKLNLLTHGNDLRSRGSLSEKQLEALEGSVARIEMLCRIEDLGTLLESAPAASRKKSSAPAPIDTLLALLNRGLPQEDADPDLNAQEDNVIRHAARSLIFYFLWKVSAMSKSIKATGNMPVTAVRSVAARRQSFVDKITRVLEAKVIAEDLRVALAGSLIDLYAAFAGLAHVAPPKREADSNGAAANTTGKAYLELVSEIPKATQNILLNILSTAEKAFAKRAKRTLDNAPTSDDEPGTDDEPEDDEVADDDDEEAAEEAKLAATLFAEQRLCEFAGKLVLGIWAGIIDGKKEGGNAPVKKRLKRNKTRLGHNFKAVVEAMEKRDPSSNKNKINRATSKTPVPQKATAAKSDAVVIDSSDESDEDEAEADGGNELEEEAEQDDADSVNAEPESVLGD